MKNNQSIISQKKQLLVEAEIILNKEYVGLETVIKQIINSISSWFLFPEIQDKPIIINLWGLTGVGKSSLIKRLSQLLDFQNKYFRFDLGQSSERAWEVKKKLEELYVHNSGKQFILGFDEFQYAKTINEIGIEKEVAHTRAIWELLDNGKFNIGNIAYALIDIVELNKKLTLCVSKGIKAQNGVVKDNLELFSELMGRYNGYPNQYELKDKNFNKEFQFVNLDNVTNLYLLNSQIYNTEMELQYHLKTLNEVETLNFLTKSIEIGYEPRLVDCTKALIIIMGNLDEAYWMHNNVNPDISANEFHEESLKINTSTIKKALQKRFRNEQIARLGNNHIIYPAFSENSFKKLIVIELEKLKQKFETKLKLKITFTDSIIEIIYKEGVFPTQGTRPLFSTINNLIEAQLPTIYFHLQLKYTNATQVILSYLNEEINFKFKQKLKEIGTERKAIILHVEKLRENKKDEMQAITAVHESGHAVAIMSLEGILPEYIYSVTADIQSTGFIFYKPKYKFISKKMILCKAASMLAGHAAERLIFGDENITSGANSDIKNATEFIFEQLKLNGFGSKIIHSNIPTIKTNLHYYDYDNEINIEGAELLEKAYLLAYETVIKEQKLLIKLANHLSLNIKITKAELKIFVQNFGLSLNCSQFEEQASFYIYKLNKANLNINQLNIHSQEIQEFGFSFNKNKIE